MAIIRAIRMGIININTLKRKLSNHQWISGRCQILEVDSDTREVVSESAREKQILRRVDLVATEMTTITDPVTGQTVTISVAGVGLAVESFAQNWMVEDFKDTELNTELGMVVFKDGSTG